MEFMEECKECGEQFEPDNMGDELCDDCTEELNRPSDGKYPRNTDLDKR